MRFKTEPIIIIDDDEDDLWIIEDVLKSFNLPNKIYCFRDANKALDGMEKLQEKIFFILCDINMPKISGLQLRKHLNDSENLREKSIPFLFYSTTGDKRIIKQAYSLNIQGYFKKTSNIDEYKLILENIMSYWSINVLP